MDAVQVIERGKNFLGMSNDGIFLIWVFLSAAAITVALFGGAILSGSASQRLARTAKVVAALTAVSACAGYFGVLEKNSLNQKWAERYAAPYLLSLPEKKEKIEGVSIYWKNADGTAYGSVYYKTGTGALKELKGQFLLEKGERDEISYRVLEQDLGNGAKPGKYMAKVSLSAVEPDEAAKEDKREDELLDLFGQVTLFQNGHPKLCFSVLEGIQAAGALMIAIAARFARKEERTRQEEAERSTSARQERLRLEAERERAEEAPQESAEADKRKKRTIRV